MKDKNSQYKYLIRKNFEYRITSISVGINKNSEQVITIGEFNDADQTSQISIIETSSEKQITLYNSKTGYNCTVLLAEVLNYSSYCIALSRIIPEKQIQNNTLLNQNSYSTGKFNSQVVTKISLWKYSTFSFINEIKLNETLYNVCYNPNNCLEIIFCGKGYLRLWNIFINDGSIKEHPQKFLTSKKENDYSFIKAEFFKYNKEDKQRSFMFAVGTLENKFLIIKGFKIIYELELNVDPYDCLDLNFNLFPTKTQEDNVYKEFRELVEKKKGKKNSTKLSHLEKASMFSNDDEEISDKGNELEKENFDSSKLEYNKSFMNKKVKFNTKDQQNISGGDLDNIIERPLLDNDNDDNIYENEEDDEKSNEEEDDKDSEQRDSASLDKSAIFKEQKENESVYYYGVRQSVIKESSILYVNKSNKDRKSLHKNTNTSNAKLNQNKINISNNMYMNKEVSSKMPYLNFNEVSDKDPNQSLNTTTNTQDIPEFVNRLYEIETKKQISNPLRTFHLVNNSMLLLAYQRGSYTCIYKLPKDIHKESNVMNGTSTSDSVNFISKTPKAFLISSHIKGVINVFKNPDSNIFVYMVENKSSEMDLQNNYDASIYGKNINLSNLSHTGYENDSFMSPVSFIYAERKGDKIIPLSQILNEYFSFDEIIDFDFCEKRRLAYILTKNNLIKCYDTSTKELVIKYNLNTFKHINLDEQYFMNHLLKKQQADYHVETQGFSNVLNIKKNMNQIKKSQQNIQEAINKSAKFNQVQEAATNLSISSLTNLFAVSFETRVLIFGNFKNIIRLVSEISVMNPKVHFSNNSTLIGIFGVSRSDNKTFNIYLLDSFTFQTVHVIEKIPHNILKMEFLNNDKMMMVLMENNLVLNWNINLNLHSTNFQSKIKEHGRGIEKYLFNFNFGKFIRNIKCSDFLYDHHQGILLMYHANSKFLSYYSNNGDKFEFYMELEDQLTYMKVISELKCLILSLKNGKMQFVKWPISFKPSINNNQNNVNLINNNSNNNKNFIHISSGSVGQRNENNSTINSNINTNVILNNQGTSIIQTINNHPSSTINVVNKNNNSNYQNNNPSNHINFIYSSGHPILKINSNCDEMFYEIPLHTGGVNKIKITKNLKQIITCSADNTIYFSKVMEHKTDYMDEFELFGNNFNEIKQSIILFIQVNEIQDYEIKKLQCLEETFNLLNKELENILKQQDNELAEMDDRIQIELDSIESQKSEAIHEEYNKLVSYDEDIIKLQNRLDTEKEQRDVDHKNELKNFEEKHEEKLNLYKTEIERLNNQLDQLKKGITNKFDGMEKDQRGYFELVFKEYSNNVSSIESEVDGLYTKLVKMTAEYDEAIYSVEEDYIKMKDRVNVTVKNKRDDLNQKILKKEKDEKYQKTELEKKENELKKWIEDSNQSIRTNAEVKQIIIETTQRTITLQEQLLETEKNLYKIDLKLQELTVKNKHLEQMRFVLEHRMKSLEKEKAPLEGQCNFLVRQKQKLEEEFNKLTLQIKLKNQELESKQSQLKANLMQNFEISEQYDYLKHKLGVVKNELYNFKEFHKNIPVDFNDPNYTSVNADGGVNHIYQQNKATYVAFKLKEFYDKFFKSSINYELMNYRFYKKQLKEETEKINASSNHDLILRNKGEEKLKSEKEKLDQIKVQKEIGFKRMENENTVLIAEANRLRKYLHEVYLRVVDIEKRFENLTHINPSLSKTEIVFQIKKFIKDTHDQIKDNFTDKYNNSSVIREENEEDYNSGDDIVNTNNSRSDGNEMYNENSNYNMLTSKSKKVSMMKNSVFKNLNNDSNENIKKSDYEGIILPPINK